MYYVYFLRSKIKTNWVYVGFTRNLTRRVFQYNNGKAKSTKPYIPLVLDSYIALTSRGKAEKLEEYFKVGSGKAILKKRILSDEALA